VIEEAVLYSQPESLVFWFFDQMLEEGGKPARVGMRKTSTQGFSLRNMAALNLAQRATVRGRAL